MDEMNNIPQQPDIAPQPNKGISIAAMVLGIVSICFLWLGFFSLIMGIIAIVLGVQGRKTCPVGAPGRGMATAGLVLGIIATVLLSVILFVYLIIVGSIAGHASYY